MEYMSGYLCIAIEGYYIEKFINICSTKQINLWNIKKENSIKMFAEPFDMVGGMLKSAVFGGIIAIVACYKGLGAKQGAEGVGIATTGSVVLSIVLIFITNYFLSILLYV